MATKRKPPGWELVDASLAGQEKVVDAMLAVSERHADMQRNVRRLGFFGMQDFLDTRRTMSQEDFGRLIMEMQKLAIEQAGGKA